MIVGGTSWWKSVKARWKFSPEEDFYWNLSVNQYYPFEDLGNGLYYIRFRPDIFVEGLICLTAVVFLTILFHVMVGNYPLPTFMCVMAILFALYLLYGHLCTRELIISRMGGYVLRIQANKKVLAEQEIYNVYIRLARSMDSLNDFHYFIIVGGYLVEDIKLSRYGRNEHVMRLLARRLARNLGINYFDYEDVSAKHIVYHYKGYSRQLLKRADMAAMFAVPWDYDVEEERVLRESTTLRKSVIKRESLAHMRRLSTMSTDVRRDTTVGTERRRSSVFDLMKTRHRQ